MVTRQIKITNKTGLHARPASLLVDKASQYESKIELIYDNQEANLKSIISVMSLAIGYEDIVTIKAEGVDEREAIKEIVEIIENNFGEE